MRLLKAGMNAIAAAVLAAVALAGGGAEAAKQVEVRFGWQPLAGGSAVIAKRMIDEKLFAKHARQFGYEITVDWKTFPAGPPSNEAMIAGQLDMDMHLAALPTVARIASGVPAIPVGIVGSHISNALMVAPNSPLNDVAMLPGKTVGLPLGTSAHYVLASIVHTHFGKSTDELGIRLVNMPVPEAVKMPQGIDVAAVWVPVRYIGPALGISYLLVDADGYTGQGHKTSGIRLPEVKNSWAYPEGYNTDRLYAFAREGFLEEHPDLIVAFLLAHDEAQQWVVANFDAAVELGNATWKQEKIVAETTLQTYAETAGVRNTPAVLEWDVLTLLKASEFLAAMKMRDRPLGWEDVKPVFAKAAEVQRRAWEMGGKKIPVAKMEEGFSGKTELYGPFVVNGGAPVWQWDEVENWGQRKYVAGPFPGAKN